MNKASSFHIERYFKWLIDTSIADLCKLDFLIHFINVRYLLKRVIFNYVGECLWRLEALGPLELAI